MASTHELHQKKCKECTSGAFRQASDPKCTIWCISTRNGADEAAVRPERLLREGP